MVEVSLTSDAATDLEELHEPLHARVEADREIGELAQCELSKTVVRQAGRLLANANRQLQTAIPG